MKAEIYIELPSQPGAAPRLARWQNGRLEPLSAAALKATDRSNAVAFAPALSVARFRVPLAAKSESEARKVALYAIEDDLAQPVEDVHLTLSPRTTGSSHRDVFIVDQSILNGWKTTLTGLGLGHAAIIPEASLAFAPGSLHDFGDRILINGTDGVVAADATWPEAAVHELIEASGVQSTRHAPTDALATLVALHTANCGTALSGTGPGQGPHGAGEYSKRWRFAGLLAGIAAAIWIASVWTDTNSLNQSALRQEAAARANFRAQFPGAPEPTDIHSEVRRLSALQLTVPRAGFRVLTSALYQAIAASPTIRLMSLSYTDQEEALRVRVQFANRADEAAFRSRLEVAGWLAETESSADGASGIVSDMIVRVQP